MNTIRNIWYMLIHTLKALYSRIRGHNKQRNVILNGQEIDMEEVRRALEPAKCGVCGTFMPRRWGQVLKYHAECRKFRHNKQQHA